MSTITDISEKERQEAFDAVFTRIKKAWGNQRPDALAARFPRLYEDLTESLNRLEKAWAAANQGVMTFDEFEAALKNWETVNYRVLSELKAVQ